MPTPKYSLCGTSKGGDYASEQRGISHNVFIKEKSSSSSHALQGVHRYT